MSYPSVRDQQRRPLNHSFPLLSLYTSVGFTFPRIMCPCFHFIVHMDSRPLRAPVGSDLFSRFHGLVFLFPYKLYSSLPCTSV
jgi:hypothetical protein